MRCRGQPCLTPLWILKRPLDNNHSKESYLFLKPITRSRPRIFFCVNFVCLMNNNYLLLSVRWIFFPIMKWTLIVKPFWSVFITFGSTNFDLYWLCSNFVIQCLKAIMGANFFLWDKVLHPFLEITFITGILRLFVIERLPFWNEIFYLSNNFVLTFLIHFAPPTLIKTQSEQRFTSSSSSGLV